MTHITINGNDVDLSALSTGTVSKDATKSSCILVQFKNELTLENKTKLVDTGIDLQEYMEEETYLCRYKPNKDLSQVQTLTFVAKAWTYPRSFVVAPNLKKRVSSAVENNEDAIAVTLQEGAEGGVDKVLADIAQQGIKVKIISRDENHMQIQVNLKDVSKIAELDNLKAMDNVPRVELSMNLALQTKHIDQIQHVQPPRQVTAIADSGLDATHEAFRNRIVGRVEHKQDSINLDDVTGHGTGVAGCAVGGRVLDARGEAAAFQGAAPGAKVFAIGLRAEAVIPDLASLFTRGYVDGNEVKILAIHNNSWNTVDPGDESKFKNQQTVTQQGSYSAASSAIVDTAMWRNRLLLILFGSGDTGQDWGDTGCQVSGCAAAKNCITVGATRQNQSTDPLREEWNPRYPKLNPGDVAGFSNRGPTRENRIKPDIVAPGAAILTARSKNMPLPEGLMADDIAPDYKEDARFQMCSGTSFSTPIVSGAAAILREAYMRKHAVGPEEERVPTGALLKALLINGAVDLAGGKNSHMGEGQTKRADRVEVRIGSAPNSIPGFGMLNVANSLLPIRAINYAEGGYVRDQELKLWQEWKKTFGIGYDTRNTNITLTWTDPPGEAMQRKFLLSAVCTVANGQQVNWDIDMPPDWRKQPGAVWHPARRNNVQRISLPDVPGHSTITINILCARTYRNMPSASFSCVWSVVRK